MRAGLRDHLARRSAPFALSAAGLRAIHRQRPGSSPAPWYADPVFPKAPRNYRPTPEQLDAIAQRHRLGPVASVRVLTGGIVNPVLLLNERAVLRVNVRDAAEPKVPKEAWALRFLNEHPPSDTWRVPPVVGAGVDRSIVPYDYLLLEYLPGHHGAAFCHDADSPLRAALSHQLGQVMAELHAVEPPGTRYGGWDRTAAALGRVDDWRQDVSDGIERAAAEAARLRALPPRRLEAVRKWLADRLDLIPRRPRRSLLHYDLSFSNILIDDSDGAARITTVLDFEWCGIGPPAAEIANMDLEECLVEDAFWNGYLGRPTGAARSPERAVDRAFLQEAHVYRVCSELAFLSVAATHWRGHGNPRRRRRIARLMDGEPTPFLARFGPPF